VTFSFDDSLPTALDRIRDAIGDTDENNPILSNESIAGYLDGGTQAQASELLAAAACLDKMAVRVAGRAVSISEGGTSVNWGDVAKRYRDQAAAFREQDAFGDGNAAFDWAEMNLSPFGSGEILRNSLLRSTV
jgi:hypothetical protein